MSRLTPRLPARRPGTESQPALPAGEYPNGEPDAPPPPRPVAHDPTAPLPADDAPDHEPDAPPPKPFFKRTKVLVTLGIVLAVAVVVGILYWLHARQFETTDDAFVEGHVIPISPQVAGHLVKVLVDDNEFVQAGDMLAQIDPADFDARQSQAQGALDVALANQKAAEVNVELTRTNTQSAIDTAQAGIKVAEAGVKSAQGQRAAAQAAVVAADVEAKRARDDYERIKSLDPQARSPQALDAANAATKTADAQLEAARTRELAAQAGVAEAEAKVTQAKSTLTVSLAGPKQIEVAQQQLQTAGGEVLRARGALAQSQLDVGYVQIKAPESGYVTRKSMEQGAYVTVGQNLCAIVPRNVWVTANFKETQVARMKPGQDVEIKVDTYKGHQTFHGKVDSIQVGTGSRFSLLPPENATGNYVKVVQRVPVKIVFGEDYNEQLKKDNDPLLSPGMSVEPSVKVR